MYMTRLLCDSRHILNRNVHIPTHARLKCVDRRERAYVQLITSFNLACLRRKHSAYAMGHVPVIDLSGPPDEVAKAVQSACSTSGFFLISNHGVPEDVIARSFEENKKFFALPEEQKAKIKVNEMNRCVLAKHRTSKRGGRPMQNGLLRHNQPAASCARHRSVAGAGIRCSRSRWTQKTKARAIRKRVCTSGGRCRQRVRWVLPLKDILTSVSGAVTLQHLRMPCKTVTSDGWRLDG